MLARLSTMPADEDSYAFEIKWDGIRALVYSGARAGAISIENRNLRDITFKYPELDGLAGLNAILDGEIVALDENGRPSFERLQGRMHLSSEAVVRARMADIPVRFMAFDVIWHDGRDVTELPYTERRGLLDELGIDGPYWQTPAWRRGDGSALLAAAREQALEGVMAKKLDSPYCPGARTKYWLKIKAKLRQEFVIAGWLPGEGRRENTLGALLVGYHDDSGALRYAGRVGTGFKERDLEILMKELKARKRKSSPFEGVQPPRIALFAEPELVAEVEFTEWTKDAILRHPAYKGLRDDKVAKDVVREVASAP